MLNRLVSSPVFATLTTVLAVVAGLLGSVYQSDVADAFPITWTSPLAMPSKAISFWGCVIAFALMFFVRQLSDDRNRERLESLVRTMPPRAFQGHLAQLVGGTHRALALVLPRQAAASVSLVGLEEIARSLLHSIARLALIFDDQPLTAKGSAVYSANVMLYEEPASTPLPPGSRILFEPPESDLDKFKGLLVLRQALSATSELPEGGKAPAPDANTPSIALPIPPAAKRGDRWAALPGAPKAFLTGDVDGYSDTATMADWCKQKGDFQPSVIDAVRTYFADGLGAEAKSLISRPLVTADNERIGVLNLQSNRREILGDLAERLPVFQAMVTPILLELTTVLVEIRKLSAAASASGLTVSSAPGPIGGAASGLAGGPGTAAGPAAVPAPPPVETV